MKKSFIMYQAYNDAAQLLTDAERGQLWTAVFEYAATGREIALPLTVKIAFAGIKEHLKTDAEKWQNIAESRREAGKMGGLQRAENVKQSKQMLNLLKQNKQSQANQAVSVSVPVSVSVSEEKNIPPTSPPLGDLVSFTSTNIKLPKAKKRKLPKLCAIPDGLRSVKFYRAWIEWQKDRRVRNKSISIDAAKRQLKRLSEYSTNTAVDMIYQSIENGWTGIFPVKTEGPPRPGSVAAIAAKTVAQLNESEKTKKLANLW